VTRPTTHAEWAVHGKRARDRGDYRILGSSRGRDEDARFEGLIRRAGPGTPHAPRPGEPGALPWVTFDAAGGDGEPYWSGIALKEWSDERDGTGRSITVTRYFTFPFADAAGPAVTYRGLYDRVAPLALPRPSAAAVPLDLPAFDARALADRMAADPRGPAWYAAVAALVLDGPVALTGAGALPLEERIDCLDAVVALLPYGLRAGLRASTWADNLAEHGVRLFFGEWVDKPHQHRARWDAVPRPAAGTVGRVYLAALCEAFERDGGPLPVVERLAGARTPLEPDGAALLAALDRLAGAAAGERHRQAAFTALADRADPADEAVLAGHWEAAREHIVAAAGRELAAGGGALGLSYLPVAARHGQDGSYLADVLTRCPPSADPAAQAALLLARRPPAPGELTALRDVVAARPPVVHELLDPRTAGGQAPPADWIAWLCPPGVRIPPWLRAFGALLPGRTAPVHPAWVADLRAALGDRALATLLRAAAGTRAADTVLPGCWRALVSAAPYEPPYETPGRAYPSPDGRPGEPPGRRSGAPAGSRPGADIGAVLGLLEPRRTDNRAGLDVLLPLFGQPPVWAARTPEAHGGRYLSGFLAVWAVPELAGRRERVARAVLDSVPPDHWLLPCLRTVEPRLARAVDERLRRGGRLRALLPRWPRPGRPSRKDGS
jgi:hypothetical protein